MQSISQCRPCLGTYVKVQIVGDSDERELLGLSLQVFEQIDRIEKLMSFHDPESELSKINREASQGRIRISPEMREILTLALELSFLTDGFFDVSVGSELVVQGALPDHGSSRDRRASWRDIHLEGDSVFFDRPLHIDLGGIAKGYAVDRAFAHLETRLAPGSEAVINAGGDLRRFPWQGERVEIRVPSDASLLLDTPMQNTAVATSSGYFSETGEHAIMSPKSKRFIDDERSVSVFAPTCMLADALTKVVFLVPDCEPLLKRFQAGALVVNRDAELSFLGELGLDPFDLDELEDPI